MSLTQHQSGDIRELSKHKEYVSLMQLIKHLRAEYQAEALNWTDTNDAYRRRGKLEGINYLLEHLEKLNYKSNLGDNHGAFNFRPPVEPERDSYFDEQPTQPSY